MSGSGFQFKQFYVRHDRCAMKVGTDGVLLGAWAGESCSYRRILDIGSGSGLVALMLAQRYRDSQIVGIDINSEAYEQACDNFIYSPWSERLLGQHVSLQDFAIGREGEFDLIVSNPPFFLDSLKNPNVNRSTARHADSLPHGVLLRITAQLLTEDGLFCVILPTDLREDFLCLAATEGLYECKRMDVYPTPQRPAKRTMLAFSKKKSAFPVRERLIIETEGRHCYSKEYRNLTEAFYLDK